MTQMQTQEVTIKRDYKSTMFKMIFEDKEKLLELYNAVSGRNYDNPELLTINTLENAIYMNVQNDLSFIIDSRLSLYEHQSTYNPNMPLRFLIYLADLYAGMVKGLNIYGSKLIPLPAPRFIVFYNGSDEQPEHKSLRLSESYVYRVRKYAKTMTIEQSVERAIDECIREDILREFLEKHRAEARSMSIYEYNQEEHMRMEREEFFEEGRKEGREEERANTERERKRAEEAERRVAEMEAELARLREEIAKR